MFVESSFRAIIEAVPDAIIIADSKGTMRLANSAAARLMGYTKSELVALSIESLLPERERKKYKDLCERYLNESSAATSAVPEEISVIKKDGTEIPVEVSIGYCLHDQAHQYAVIVLRDISVRKRIQDDMQHSLREKEVLLKEVHHRVKNSLQIISSIINLQSHAIADPSAKALLDDTRARVRSIALVHERLYESKDLNQVDFREYVEGLVSDLFVACGVQAQNVQVQYTIDPIFLEIDKAVNCGLIINELVSNALKYAFDVPAHGAIMVTVRQDGTSLMLQVRDNGKGLPQHFDLESSRSLGLTLVHGLAKELGGEFHLTSEEGVEITITIPHLEKDARD